MTEIEQLQQSIAALEAQRALLGDAVVDTALASMREKLAALQAQAAHSPQRKQVTVLFADVSGFTALGEALDAEEVTEMMNALWQRLDAVIIAHHGRIDKHIGDAVMALWGAEQTREDDAEQALHAALALQAALADYHQDTGFALQMRIGINTGPVLLGEIGSTREFTAMGDTVNLASRLEGAAPVGGILIAQNTYDQVRGSFELRPLSPLTVKGKTDPVNVYTVERAKTPAFRMESRGVAGIETRMVGRDAELRALQEAFSATAATATPAWVLITGDAGIGKSRLLYEFEQWLHRQTQPFALFKGRAAPVSQSIPYGILRALYASSYSILENDSPAIALTKFRTGMSAFLTPDRADLVGHWMGFDFSSSPAVQNLLESPDFGKLAQSYFTNTIRASAQAQPLVIFMEDLHWADDSSLDMLERLRAALPTGQLLLVGLARPTLFERRPAWRTPPQAWQLIALETLSPEASDALVEALLQRLPAIPEALRRAIVSNAEGNPFYAEELVKVLLTAKVIVGHPEKPGAWQVDLDSLQRFHIPSTLVGLLQARLDSLTHLEREMLQRAAVVGRHFWDATVAELGQAPVAQIQPTLEALLRRGLLFKHEPSAFAGTQEYRFKHALLRDVTYETVLLKVRRDYHAQVARWLEVHAGERINETISLIAGHLERAGEAQQAARYLSRAGSYALWVSAFKEALEFFQRALALAPENTPERVRLLCKLGNARLYMGDYQTARQVLEQAAALAQTLAQTDTYGEALSLMGIIASIEGDPEGAQAHLETSLAIARQNADTTAIAKILYNLGWLEIRQGAYQTAEVSFLEAQTLARAGGDQHRLITALNGLGTVKCLLQAYEQARTLFEESLELSRRGGNRLTEAIALGNLGETARWQGLPELARQYYQAALVIHQEIGSKINIVLMTGNLGHAAAALGDVSAAVACYREALQLALQIRAIPYALESLAGWALALTGTGQSQLALTVLGMVAQHPALQTDTQTIIHQALARLREQVPPDVIEAGLQHGKTLQLETVVAELLAQPAN